MKKFIFFLVALLAVAACIPEYDEMMTEASRAVKPGEDTFYATIETAGEGDAQTKVYADEQMRVLWNAGDTISIFKKTTFNRPYRFTGQEGSNAGGFNKIAIDDEFITEYPLGYNYAVYPYREATLMSYDGELAMEMPAVQAYKKNSFGIGANTMVSATEDNILQFKNAGGYLSFKFYGEGVSVKSISLKGNNHEKLAGAAKVTMSLGGMPVVAMQGTATEEITLSCAEPVALGADAEHYTEFWFVLPPTEFTNGFSVTVTDKRGGTFTTSTSNSVSVTRNNLSRMAPMEVIPEYEYVPFDDANFKAYCVANFDRNGDGEISMTEASYIRNINVNVSTADIESLQGIEFMPNLYYLSCRGQSSNNRGKLTSLNVRKNTALLTLYCQYNQLASLDVRNNTALLTLNCQYNQLSTLDVSNNTALQTFYCYNNKLTSLNVSNNTALTRFDCGQNQLTNLDVSKNTALTNLNCGGTQLTTLDVSKNTALQSLSCYNNQLTSLSVSSNTALTNLSCGQNQLTSLDVSKNMSLQSLSCYNNKLTSLSVSNNMSLTYLECGQNQLTSLDVNKNTALQSLYCYNNKLTSLSVSNNTALTNLNCGQNQLTSLDVSQNTALQSLSCYNNQLTSLSVSNNKELMSLDCGQNQLTSLEVSKNTALVELYCYNNQLTNLDVSKNSALSEFYCTDNASNLVITIRRGQLFKTFRYDKTASIVETGDPVPQGNISFADPTFKAYCVRQFDIDKDGEISYAEALLFTEVGCSNQGITSLAGIEFFENLRYLYCDNNQLTSLDVSHNTALVELTCYNNKLTSLNVSNNTVLVVLICEQNQLTSLDVSQNTVLQNLDCYNNQLKSLNVSNNTALIYLNCEQNQLTSLDVSLNTALESLSCYNNPNLAEIWLKKNQTIRYFGYDSSVTTIKYKD